MTWADDPRVRIVTTMKHERCVARNTGAAIAQGDYLHFLDDEDWLAPGALRALQDLAARNSSAGLLHGATQLVDRENRPLIQLRSHFVGNCSVQTMAGEWIPLQSSLVATKQFFAIGCFNVLIPSSEDIDLVRRLTLVTEVASTGTIVAWVGMGVFNSTTDYVNHDNLALIGREQALNSRGAYSRMRSAATTAEWKGRLVRIYLTSAVWNARQQNWSTAFGRGVTALAGTISAGAALFHTEFYRALRSRYKSGTFARGFAEMQAAGEPKPAVGRST
jgi:glycosyltransferase involved in cell wall biosynthesis